MKKLLTSLLALAMLIPTLAACSTTNDQGNVTAPDTTEAPVVETQPVETDVTLFENGVSNYVIVRPDNASQTVIDLAVEFRKSLETFTGTTVELRTDWVPRNQTNDPNTKEILIGDVIYDNVDKVLNELAYGEYIVKNDGNKIVIAAYSNIALSVAVREFTDEIKKMATKDDAGNTVIKLPSDYVKKNSYSDIVNAIPHYDGGNVEGLFPTGDLNHMLYVEKTTLDEFNAYKAKLEKEGFKVYATNTIANNYHATYTNNDYIINTYFADSDKTTRVIIEKNNNLLPNMVKSTAAPVTTSLITMIGLEKFAADGTSTQNGLSILIRLDDGRFIIIDGGFNRSYESTTFLKLMKEQAPDPNNIVVAAWIFTHSHGDHTGMFNNFSTSNLNQIVKVESFIANLISDEQNAITGAGQNNMIKGFWSTNYKDSKIYKAHTGQKYVFGNAEIEMLYTWEDRLPNDVTYFNMSSLVFTITIGGQKIMFLGDCDTTGTAVLVRKYGATLKSDIVQVTHHGYDGGSIALYKNIEPTYILWPVGDQDYARNSTNREENVYLIAQPNVKEIWVAGSKITTIPLPYTKAN